MLVAEGEKVWIFDRQMSEGRLSGLQDCVRTFQGELGNYSHVLEAVKASMPSAIFHLGAMLSIPADKDPPAAFSSNVEGVFHVLEASRLLGTPKVIFASTTATYGMDIKGAVIDDSSLQRPTTMYGTTKVFGELLGRFYRTRYDVDFRALRFPSVVGPGAKVEHLSIYNSWAIEKAIRGEPYSIFVEPYIRCPVLYFRDAARSLRMLEATPRDSIQAVCYTLAGINPMPSAGELAAAIREYFPKSTLDFAPDEFAMRYHCKLQGVVFDDSSARRELGWKPEYTLQRMIVDFAEECTADPERYR
jgi:threonine 3-dehydrogenase